jgi:hypothetical protein
MMWYRHQQKALLTDMRNEIEWLSIVLLLHSRTNTQRSLIWPLYGAPRAFNRGPDRFCKYGSKARKCPTENS